MNNAHSVFPHKLSHMTLAADMPPLIITCGLTGGFQKSDNPNLPVTADEQADEAKSAADAGAAIVHIHGRNPSDPTQPAETVEQYRAINAAIRSQHPSVIIETTQTNEPLQLESNPLIGSINYSQSTPMDSKPETMALNPGPMTFRGSATTPSKGTVATFDDTERAALDMRERGIKPQFFVYHLGHIDLLEYLITRDVLEKPYYLQLVLGQQSGTPLSVDNLATTVRNLPTESIYQTCALGQEAVHVNLLAILMGGHVRTGMEDNVDFLPGVPATGNAQLVQRIAEFARMLGREVATPKQAREMLGLGEPSTYDD